MKQVTFVNKDEKELDKQCNEFEANNTVVATQRNHCMVADQGSVMQRFSATLFYESDGFRKIAKGYKGQHAFTIYFPKGKKAIPIDNFKREIKPFGNIAILKEWVIVKEDDHYSVWGFKDD